ncbi:hypothetical protein LINGRAHAP2_LOCUS18437, partial [Linum grandiflorum]
SVASAGGVIRNFDGKVLQTYSHLLANLGRCTITMVEFRGVIFGLRLVWDRGYRNVNLQRECVTHSVRFQDCLGINQMTFVIYLAFWLLSSSLTDAVAHHRRTLSLLVIVLIFLYLLHFSIVFEHT